MNAQQISATFKIDLVQAAQLVEIVEAGDHLSDISDELFETLYEHYVETNELPYEVASKGDPYEWIAAKLAA